MTLFNQKHIATRTSPIRHADFFNAYGVKIAHYTIGNTLTTLCATRVFNTHRGYVKPLVATLMAHVCLKSGIEFALSNADVILKSHDFEKIRSALHEATVVISKNMGAFVTHYEAAKKSNHHQVIDTYTDPILADYQSPHTPFLASYSETADAFFPNFSPTPKLPMPSTPL